MHAEMLDKKAATTNLIPPLSVPSMKTPSRSVTVIEGVSRDSERGKANLKGSLKSIPSNVLGSNTSQA